MTTSGGSSPGISGFSADGFVQITSGSVETFGTSSRGLVALGHTEVLINSSYVDTFNINSGGIVAYSDTADSTNISGSVVTRRDHSARLDAAADLARHSLPVVSL